MKGNAVSRNMMGGWPTFNDVCVHHFYRGCPILALFARVGGETAGTILCAISARPGPHIVLRSVKRPTVQTFPTPAPSPTSGRALRKVREGPGIHSVGDAREIKSLGLRRQKINRGQSCLSPV